MALVLRSLGNTGIRVSPVGLGTVKFGRNSGVRYPRSFELPEDAALERLLAVARECGINLLDTAPAYGTSEARLGRLLSGTRDQWIISTKSGENFIDNSSTFDFSEKGTRRSVEQSLRLLGTDYLDIVLVHCSDDDLAVVNRSDALETLSRLKDKGMIRAFGASTKTLEGGLAALDRCDIVMATYNMDDTSQSGVLDKALELGKGVFVKKALESGHSRDAASALRFVLDHPAVSSVIVGTINEDHLRANVIAASS